MKIKKEGNHCVHIKKKNKFLIEEKKHKKAITFKYCIIILNSLYL